MPNAKAEKQARGVRGTLRLNRSEQVIDGLFLPSLPSEQRGAMLFEAEDVSRFGDPSKVEKFLNGLLAQPLNVERTTADEMAEPFEPLRAADQPAGAADIDFALFAHGLRPAYRAMIGEEESGTRFVAGQIVDHLRDDIARTLHHYPVARPHAKPLDLVGIVQRHVGHYDAPDRHGGEPPNRRQLARPTNLNVDRLQGGLRPFRREFMRDGPARRLGNKAQPLLPIEPVDLVDHPIDVERKVSARSFNAPIMCNQGVERIDAGQHVRHRQAPARNCLHDAKLRLGRKTARLAPTMRKESQRAAGGDGGVLLPQRSRRSVARVGELPRLFRVIGLREQALIERDEVRLRHINLTPDLEQVGYVVAGQAVGNIADVAHIGGHILARHAIATGRGEA